MRQTYRYDFIITSMLFMQHFQDPPAQYLFLGL